jgi:hypothetical protein
MPWDHFHTLFKSSALDSDGDGFSDALEEHFETDALDPYDHPDIVTDHSPFSSLSDLDGDGFPDSMEHIFSTDPLDPLDHPDAILANHALVSPDNPLDREGVLDVGYSDVTV